MTLSPPTSTSTDVLVPPPTASPSSFRDPDARVHLVKGRVLRTMSERGARTWDLLAASRFFGEAVEQGRVVGTEVVAHDALPAPLGPAATVLEHERIEVITDPCEWPFSALQAAALVHLDLLAAALQEGLSLKDGAAHNVQLRGTAAVFVDVGSFEPRDGRLWAGYRQFCSTFLYPLLLEARRGLPCQLTLRASVNGPTAEQTVAMLRRRDRWRPATFAHLEVLAHDERRRRRGVAAGDAPQVSEEVDLGLVRRLRSLIAGLRPQAPSTGWSRYSDRAHYAQDEVAIKEAVVAAASEGWRPDLVLDLGANDGRFSRVAARVAPVVALDRDPQVVDGLYRSLVAEPAPHPILPLVVDLLDPTPARGWRNEERPSFFSRVDPDLVLCLALVHHLCIGGNVPPGSVVEMLRSFDAPVVFELPHRDDPMVQQMLARKGPHLHLDYRRDTIEALLVARFEVMATRELATRTLYELKPR